MGTMYDKYYMGAEIYYIELMRWIHFCVCFLLYTLGVLGLCLSVALVNSCNQSVAVWMNWECVNSDIQVSKILWQMMCVIVM